MSLVRAFAFSVALAGMAAFAAVADDAPKPDQSTPPINVAVQVSRGDSWTYDIRDDVTGEARATVKFEVTRVTDSEIETRVSQFRQATKAETTTTEIFDARWRTKNNGGVIFRPYLDSTGIPADLQVGKSWSFKFEVLRKGATLTQEFAGVGKVEAWERITLPNGAAYDAFKIDVMRAPSRAMNGRKSEAHSIEWFAPAVNRLVKRIDESRVNGRLRDATEQTLREFKPAGKS